MIGTLTNAPVGDLSGDRGHVDNATLAFRDHGRLCNGLRAEKDTREVDSDDPVPELEVVVLGRTVLVDSRIVDQHVDSAQRSEGSIYHAFHL